ncbi:helix-hairpin-helix domain-containing protein [Vagococcus sp.]|uniref:helix-hairpin-helix domain-containing protein n=1 Tax=Vagococcus sp. TaxID=1933889 RepID=UPI003F975D23
MANKRRQHRKVRKLLKSYFWFLIAFLVTLVILVGVVIGINQKGEETLADELKEEQYSASTSEKVKEVKEENEIKIKKSEEAYVDVKGAVKKPGMYPVEKNMRIFDVIKLAGGLTEEADLNQLNYAQKVMDQMVIYVLKKGEKNPIKELTVTNGTNVDNITNQEKDQEKTNINTAELEDLKKLNGIGQKKAEAIKLYREENGLFKKVEDLTKVKGIGEKTFESLKQSITIE